MTTLLSRVRRCLAAFALLLALPATATDVELPPVDAVFVLSAKAEARNRVTLRWTIAVGLVECDIEADGGVEPVFGLL